MNRHSLWKEKKKEICIVQHLPCGEIGERRRLADGWDRDFWKCHDHSLQKTNEKNNKKTVFFFFFFLLHGVHKIPCVQLTRLHKKKKKAQADFFISVYYYYIALCLAG